MIVSGNQESHLCIFYNNSRAAYSDIYSIMEYLISRTAGKNFMVESARLPEIISGRGGKIVIHGVQAGIIGEMDPAVYTDFGIQNPVAFLEVNLGILFADVE